MTTMTSTTTRTSTLLEEALEGYMMEMLMTMFNESDADNSGGLLEELEHFIEDIDAMEDEDIGSARWRLHRQCI